MKKILVHYCKVILSISIILGLQTHAEQITMIRHDSYFPIEIAFYDQDNQKRFLEEYEGNVILLVFWASWCGGCVDELPKLDNLQKDFRKLPFKVIALSEDHHNIEFLKNYFAKKDIRYLEIFKDQNSELMTKLIVAGLPTAYLIDIDGKLKAEFKGNVKWELDEVRKIIIEEFKDNIELPRNSFKYKQFVENLKPTSEEQKLTSASDPVSESGSLIEQENKEENIRKEGDIKNAK
ncbi:MAG: TlpA family protein disulfide reductase [Rickettsiaceae bacterium]|nr:TlpA family protein disulfide reductase [Rickettsiaceae bacterium]